MNNPRPVQRRFSSFTPLLPALAASAVAGLLAGCGTALPGTATGTGTPVSAFISSGNVHGGQQPVSGATIQLYTVGTSGLRSASTPLLVGTTTSDANGNFNITGKYTCTNATQVYITATGGNPGGGTNSAISLVTALGSCSALTPATFIQINEVSTIAAAYALAPFAADLTHVGATGSSPTGLVNALANATLLVGTASGGAPGAAPAGVTVPVSELNTLANIIAACVNTTGASSSSCTTLFNATAASDTFGAALAIAKNPGTAAIVNLYSLSSASAPFQPSMTMAPKDFTVAVTSSAGGALATPYGIAIDAAGNAWVTNESGTTVSEVSSMGMSLANPTTPGLFGPQGVAIDRSGNVWVANTAGNSLVKFTLASGTVSSASSFTTGVSAPSSVAVDSAGNAFVANFNGNSVAGFTSAGVALANSPFTGSNNNITVPTSIAVGPAGSLYVTSGNGSVVKLSNTGVYTAAFNDGSLQAPAGVAVDSSTRVAATGFTTGASVGYGLSEFSSVGTAVTGSPVTSGLAMPQGVATDNTSLWVANGAASGSLAQYIYGATSPTSPIAGYGTLSAPQGVAVDASGCVWTANSGSNTVSKFIGLAVPVTTPLASNVGP